MRHEFVLLSAASLSLIITACSPRSAVDPQQTQLADSESSATQDTFDISDAAAGSNSFTGSPAPRVASPATVAGCTVTRVVQTTATACGNSYDAAVTLTWSCEGPNGGTSSGTANVATTVTPDACPATTLAIAQTIGFDRTRTFQEFSGNLAGTAAVSWNIAVGQEAATKQASLQLEHKITKSGVLIRHQTLDGSKTVDIAGAGDARTRTVNGSVDVKFLLAGDDLQVTESNLFFQHSACCYPLSGELSWAVTGNATKAGSLTFGPACGQAVDAQGGGVEFPPCSELN